MRTATKPEAPVVQIRVTIPRAIYDGHMLRGVRETPTRQLAEVFALACHKLAPGAQAFGVMSETKLAYFVWAHNAEQRSAFVAEVSSLCDSLREHEGMCEKFQLSMSKKPVPEIEWRYLFLGLPIAIGEMVDRPEITVFGNPNFQAPKTQAEGDAWQQEYETWANRDAEVDAIEPVSPDDLVNMFIPPKSGHSL